VQNINTQMFAFLNGWFVHDEQPLLTFENGIIVGTILEAVKQYPELVLQHFSKIRPNQTDGLIALNEALFCDGIFIYIPDNVQAKMPIQVVSLIESDQNLMLQHHNLIVMGKMLRYHSFNAMTRCVMRKVSLTMLLKFLWTNILNWIITKWRINPPNHYWLIVYM
jgi:Fe-S cluster assembly scaffold protein SufB